MKFNYFSILRDDNCKLSSLVILKEAHLNALFQEFQGSISLLILLFFDSCTYFASSFLYTKDISHNECTTGMI